MQKRLLILSFILLAACKPSVPADTTTESGAMMNNDTEQMMIDDNDPSNDDDDMIQGSGSVMRESAVFTAYTPDVLTNGKPKVLFFHAAWCPICRDADVKLQSWFDADKPMIDVYTVDYDTEKDLKAKYGITYQHTFVLVNGQGDVVQKIQGPTDAALMAMIGAE